MTTTAKGSRMPAHLLTGNEQPLSFERRNHARLPLTLAVRQLHDGVLTFHESRDVSAGGLRLDWGLRLPLRTRVELRFMLPGEVRLFKLPAEVVANNWNRGAPSTSLHFLPVQGDIQVILAHFVDQHLTMPWQPHTPT
ncbi:MAG: PilZ domain-containing protein [Pseudomonadota bacterium]